MEQGGAICRMTTRLEERKTFPPFYVIPEQCSVVLERGTFEEDKMGKRMAGEMEMRGHGRKWRSAGEPEQVNALKGDIRWKASGGRWSIYREENGEKGALELKEDMEAYGMG